MLILTRAPDLSRPLTWKPYRGQDGVRRANIVGACGHGMYLRGHSITADGTVAPSVVCPHKGCAWHVFVRLDGWDGGAVARGATP